MCLPTCIVLFFIVLFFCCLVFFSKFFYLEKAPQRLFSCNFKLFFLFYIPKRLVFKILLFFLFYFLIRFSFCLPFQNSMFCFLSINTILENTIIFGFFFFFFLSYFFLRFPFLIFACFFQTNFPNIPFVKPKLLSFLVVSLFLLLLFGFHVSCFCLSVFMLALFLVYVYFVLVLFSFGSCFAFADNEIRCSPCNSSVSSHVGYRAVILFYFFQFHVLVLACFSCVVCFYFRQLSYIILCLCCLFFFCENRTKWVLLFHLVVFFPFCCFVFLSFVFFFSFLSNKRPKTGHGKNPKKQTCRKKGQKHISVSAVPFDRKLLHCITLFSRIHYVWCNVIVYMENGLWIICRRYNSGRYMTGYLPSAWNTKITLHQSFGN